jgi:molybdopterin-biosynthesis enzyme MoeA-like protein
MMAAMVRTAAALVIGNEILTGKVREMNVEVLARELFGLGVELRRVVICPDEVEVIVADLNALRTRHDAVFTSGGVGPTHDDVTIAAVARAFGRPVVRSPELEALLRRHLGARLTERHLRMADLPEGYSLEHAAGAPWPAVVVDNVYVLPGLPEVFRMKLPIIRERFSGDAPFVSRAVYTLCDEGEVAELLESLVAEHREVAIGSYPVWGNDHYRVKLTFDGKDAVRVAAAAAALVAALAPEKIVPSPEG